jgi:hypothetical protein
LIRKVPDPMNHGTSTAATLDQTEHTAWCRDHDDLTLNGLLHADPDDGICHTTLSSADMSHTRGGGTLISLDAVRDPLTLAEAEQLADALRKLITRARSAMEAA